MGYKGPVRAQYDVIIVGAGPGGAAAASLLTEMGHENILVLERYRFPRPKPCGGGLTGHVDPAMKETHLELRVPHWPAYEAKVRFGSFMRTVHMGKPVNIVRREDFDADLVDQVRAKGVEIVEGEGVKRLEVEPDFVRVITSKKRELTARIVLGADGAASIVRKHILNNEKKLPHRLFKCEMSLAATDEVDSAMLYDFTPMARGVRGYLWMFPLPDRRINVGVMHYPADRKSGTELTNVLREGLSELGVELADEGTRGWPAWGYDPSKPISKPRILVIGDAAGIDGLTGEGIAVAMEHAVVACHAIDRALATDDMAFSSYRKDIRRATVGRELALDRWLARLLYRRGEAWRNWLSLVLFDPDVLEMYAARVSGSDVLADQKLRLYKALFRHMFKRGARRRELEAALPGKRLELAPAPH
jgi:geranylgeranyl reductase family protein